MRGKYITITLQLAAAKGCSQQKKVSEQSKLIIEGQQGYRSKEVFPTLHATVEQAETGSDDEHGKSYFIL